MRRRRAVGPRPNAPARAMATGTTRTATTLAPSVSSSVSCDVVVTTSEPFDATATLVPVGTTSSASPTATVQTRAAQARSVVVRSEHGRRGPVIAPALRRPAAGRGPGPRSPGSGWCLARPRDHDDVALGATHPHLAIARVGVEQRPVEDRDIVGLDPPQCRIEVVGPEPEEHAVAPGGFAWIADVRVLVRLPLVELRGDLPAVQQHLVVGTAVAGRETQHLLEPPRARLDVGHRDQRLGTHHAQDARAPYARPRAGPPRPGSLRGWRCAVRGPARPGHRLHGSGGRAQRGAVPCRGGAPHWAPADGDA